ncbi:MAG: EAL domain-containing protein [Geminicoccaceae bacterium]
MTGDLAAEAAALLDTAEAALIVVRPGAEPRRAAEIVFVNRRLLELTGHARDALEGRSLRRLRGASEGRERFTELLAAIRTGGTFEGPLALATAQGPDRLVDVRLARPEGARDLVLLWLQPEPGPATSPAELARHAAAWAGLTSECFYLLAVEDDLRLRLVWADAACSALLGGAGGAVPERGPAGLALPAERDRLRARDQRLLAGEETELVYRLRAADGTVRTVRDRSRPLADRDGIVRFVAGTLGELQEVGEEGSGAGLGEQLLETLAGELEGAVLLLDARGNRLRAAGRIGGVPAASARLQPAEQDLLLDLLDAALTAEAPVRGELAFEGPTGGTRVRIELRRLGADRALALLRPPIEPPVDRAEPAWTPRAAAPEPALAEAPAAFEHASPALLDSVAAALLGIDVRGTVRFANEAAAVLFGVEPDRLVGRTVEQLFGGVETTAELHALLLEQLPRSRAVRELSGLREEGEVLPLEVAARWASGPGELRVVLTLRDATLARHTEEALRTLAYLDPLTGLPNRILFNDRLGQAIARTRRQRQLLAVLLLDLDRFKLVNDSLGLERGDQLLKSVGERLVGTLRRSDTVARMGSDEFLVLLTGLEQAEPIVKVAHKLLAALERPFTVNGHELTVSASIGVAVYPHDGDEPGLLVKNADTALGRAKELGRGHVQFYTNDMNAQAFERLMLENRLRRALENGELVVYYQPQVSLRTGEVVGVEALVRWFHPELGLVPPGEFIPLAEDTGLILPIGFWAMETACLQVAAWQRELGRPDLRLAVNLSARQFQHAELAARIAEILERTGFTARCLELELTESVVMREASESMRRMRELTALGLALSIDDFGTGYSSLAYLRSFPIRSLKIDRSFVQDVDRDPSSATIVQAIVAMGASLGLNVVAEGVETSQQLRQLRRMGCHEMQGFLVSRALPAADLLPVLRDGRLEDDGFLVADGG